MVTTKRRWPGSAATSLTVRIAKAARDHFGFDSLRPGQEARIRSLLKGRDSLVVMPTGAGKSAIYQVAGSLMKGTVIVVSPLIALQKDQVDSIEKRSDQKAVVVNSTQNPAEARAAFEKLASGRAKYVFLAPEQLRKKATVEQLEELTIALFVVDEAHCISEWGHDFRPDYLDLGPVIERLGHPVVLAMTATASAPVRDEIVKRLCLRDAEVFVYGFDRPNIYLRVDQFADQEEKRAALLHRVRWAKKPGLIYVATRQHAEDIMRSLGEEGIRALFYHAGLKANERHQIQEQFMSGKAEVIVATNAFGMGIDKADVRFVYHYEVSDSLDSYFQEIGRAGRDGEPAEAVLFFRPEDMGVQKFHSGEAKLLPKEVAQVTEAIAAQDGPATAQEIGGETNLSSRKLAKVIHRLEDVGAVELLPDGGVQITGDVDLPNAAEAAAEEQERRRLGKAGRLRQLQQYIDTAACRREHLLRYFGDDFTGPCDNCDNCQTRTGADPSVGTRREVAGDSASA